MTTINIATDVPSQINTLERLVMWSLLALRACNPTLRVIEIENTQGELVAQTSIFQANDGSLRFFCRGSIPIDPDYAADTTKKLWQNAQELSNTALPAAFKIN